MTALYLTTIYLLTSALVTVIHPDGRRESRVVTIRPKRGAK